MELRIQRLIKQSRSILVVQAPSAELELIHRLNPRLLLDADQLVIWAGNRKLELNRASVLNWLGVGDESKLLAALDRQLESRVTAEITKAGLRIIGISSSSRLEWALKEFDPDICYIKRGQSWIRKVPIWIGPLRLLDAMLAECIIQEYNPELKLARCSNEAQIPSTLIEQINLELEAKPTTPSGQ